jgi:putative FmdB family regulatory protein
MPLYEYECDACGRRFERIQKFSDPPETVCPTCGGSVRKLLSSPAIQFKGSGFYITDYVKTGAASDGKKPAEAASDSSEKTEKGDTSSKAAPATEGKSTDSTSSESTSKTETAKKPAAPPTATKT